KNNLYVASAPESPNSALSAVSPEQWHLRLGHPGKARTELLQKANPSLNLKHITNCDTCLRAKSKQSSHPASASLAKKPLELVHMDVCTMPHPGPNQERYYMLFLDDFSKHIKVYPMKLKTEALRCIQDFVRQSEAVTGHHLRTLRTD